MIYALFTGSFPNQSMKDKMLKKEIGLPRPSASISQACIDIIKKCTKYLPDERPSFEEIISEMKSVSFKLACKVDPKIV